MTLSGLGLITDTQTQGCEHGNLAYDNTNHTASTPSPALIFPFVARLVLTWQRGRRAGCCAIYVLIMESIGSILNCWPACVVCHALPCGCCCTYSASNQSPDVAGGPPYAPIFFLAVAPPPLSLSLPAVCVATITSGWYGLMGSSLAAVGSKDSYNLAVFGHSSLVSLFMRAICIAIFSGFLSRFQSELDDYNACVDGGQGRRSLLRGLSARPRAVRALYGGGGGDDDDDDDSDHGHDNPSSTWERSCESKHLTMTTASSQRALIFIFIVAVVITAVWITVSSPCPVQRSARSGVLSGPVLATSQVSIVGAWAGLLGGCAEHEAEEAAVEAAEAVAVGDTVRYAMPVAVQRAHAIDMAAVSVQPEGSSDDLDEGNPPETPAQPPAQHSAQARPPPRSRGAPAPRQADRYEAKTGTRIGSL